MLKRFSGTILAGSSESSAHEPKVIPRDCVLRHKCAPRHSPLYSVAIVLAVTHMPRGRSALAESQIARGLAHVGVNVGKMAHNIFQKTVAFKLGILWLIELRQ